MDEQETAAEAAESVVRGGGRGEQGWGGGEDGGGGQEQVEKVQAGVRVVREERR